MAEKTEIEEQVLRLSLELIESRLAIKEAFVRQKWYRAVRMMQKERRDKKVNEQ